MIDKDEDGDAKDKDGKEGGKEGDEEVPAATPFEA